ncbi:hypothetical protein I547_7033 [Mycobacterium kansasii 824]|uniref:Uncharacterized protein n=1 Tax=Mycobacterium kansasii TaxID=1768 RepID=A0A1V3X0X3_MYCKA|nr:hypothetical protein I547_7033 [Mycobacterium kansasii 824]OOK72727.1 hypothetical protein BZL29_4797 [Mycobacterium kansasii]OOK76040.1 hypothetical protein BZL30_3100 [Mycobacterium kansasii]
MRLQYLRDAGNPGEVQDVLLSPRYGASFTDHVAGARTPAGMS